jgi:hypothetical protein
MAPKRGLSVGAILGIVFGGLAVLVLGAFAAQICPLDRFAPLGSRLTQYQTQDMGGGTSRKAANMAA